MVQKNIIFITYKSYRKGVIVLFRNLLNIDFHDIKPGDILYLLSIKNNKNLITISRVIRKNDIELQVIDANNITHNLHKTEFNVTYFFNKDIAYYMSYTQ